MPYLGNNHIVGDSVKNFKVLDDISTYTATFDGSASSVVSTAAETIKVVDHRFVNGQRVTYNNGGGSNIGGLSSGTAYYVIYDTAHTIKLATSASNAASLTAINLNAVGGGTSHTLNASFDGVNKKFRITHGSGNRSRFHHATQLSIAVNNVVQRPNNNANNFTEGYAVEIRDIIVFKTAPTVNDIFFGSLTGETRGTFEISDHKIDNYTGDGSTVEYTLSQNVPNAESLLVSLNGVIQHPTDASTTRSYSLLTDNVITFTTAPALGVEIQIRHLGFAGASSGDVSGFYGRTGNVGLTASDHITTGDITSRNINSSGIITATSFSGGFSGNIVGTSATFTGNVTIGGTLAYEDVTNIDSVGIITAQKDIHVGAGVSAVGVGTFGSLDIGGVSTFSDDVTLTGAGGNVVFDKSDNSLNIKDGCALKFGDGSDLSIFHGGSGLGNATFIDENGSGRLRIRTNDYVEIGKIASAEMSARFFADGACELYHDNVKRLETSAKGIQVGTGVTIETNGQATFTGIITASSYRGDGSALTGIVADKIFEGDTSVECIDSGSNGKIELKIDNALKLELDNSGQLLPGADDAQNLGSSTKRWKNIYAADMHFSNQGKINDVDGTWGDWTLQEGEDSVFMINNRTGKKYAITMKEVN